MTVMVLGSGGFIGRAIAEALVGRGHRVVCARRSMQSDLPQAMVAAVVDRADPASVVRCIRDNDIDALIDVVGYTAEETAPLLRAIDGLVGRYLFVSSSDVYRNHGLLHRKETGTPEPGRIVEISPLRESRYPYRAGAPRAPGDPAKWMDQYDKIEVEALVRDLRMPWTIARLPMVVGRGDPQRRFDWAVQPMRAGVEAMELPRQWLDWETSYELAGDVGRAVAALIEMPAAAGLAINITSGCSASHADWASWLSAALGWTGRMIPTDDPGHPLAEALAGLDLSVPLRLGGERCRALLPDMAWTPLEEVALACARAARD